MYQTIWEGTQNSTVPEYSLIFFLKNEIELKQHYIQCYNNSDSITSGKPCCFLHLRFSIARLSQSFLSLTFFLLKACNQKPYSTLTSISSSFCNSPIFITCRQQKHVLTHNQYENVASLMSPYQTRVLLFIN